MESAPHHTLSVADASEVEALRAALDPATRQLLALRCGYAPPVVALSVAGFVSGHLIEAYEGVLATQGIVLPALPPLPRTPQAATPTMSRQRPHLTPGRSGPIDLQPLFSGVQRAIHPHLPAALRAHQLEAQVLRDLLAALAHMLPSAELTARLTHDADHAPAHPAGTPLRQMLLTLPQAQRVHPAALAFMHTTAEQAVAQAQLQTRTLDELEAMLAGRGFLLPLLPPSTATEARTVTPATGRSRSRGSGRDSDAGTHPFAAGTAAIPMNPAVWALLRAIRDAISTSGGWALDGDADDAPRHTTHTNRGRGRIEVQVRQPVPAPSTASRSTSELPNAATSQPTPANGSDASDLWAQVRRLDELTADALLVCLAAWVAGGAGSTPVWVTVDAILDARGLRRIQLQTEPDGWQHGHRREDRLAAGRALAHLASLWLQVADVDVVPARGGNPAQRVHGHSRAMAVLDAVRASDDAGEPVLLAVHVLPGEWAQAFAQAGMRSVGQLSQQALAYDPYRERPERWLARYLAFSARWNQQRRRPARRLRVRTLLENAALTADSRRPQRTRDRLERALLRLQADGLLAGWHYEGDPGALPARRWLDQWQEMIIVLHVPRPPSRTANGHAAPSNTATN